ncbi:MAG: hypothetical protein JO112_19970 [Planctomycetes bacterium]|nr:hypothetical protein [Planctomycetota bacterium]
MRFTIEFEEPTREQKLSVKCPYCEAEPGFKCQRDDGRWDEKTQTMVRKMKKINLIHHDRIALSLGLKIVQRASIYKL